MDRHGFTIVELIITITIIGILLIVGVVNLRGTQVNARDSERKIDIDSISFNLEAFYKSGTDSSTIFGRYPSTAMFDGTDETFQSYLRDIDIKVLKAPGIDNAYDSFLPATNSVQTTSGVLPVPSVDTYVYQPLKNDGSLCTLETEYCQKFNLYYATEADSTIYMVTSKNQ